MVDTETIKQIFSIFQPHLYKFYIAIGVIFITTIITIIVYYKRKNSNK